MPNLCDIDCGSPVNLSAPLNKGLGAWWLGLPGINSGAAIPNILRPNSLLHAYRTGSSTTYPSWATDYNGFGCQSFDGSTHYLNASTSDVFAVTNNFTAACSFRQTAASGYVLGLAGLMTRYHNGASGAWGLKLYGSELALYGTAGVIVKGGARVLNKWHHAVGTVTPGGLITVYLDGVSVGSGTDTINTASGEPLYFGVDYLTSPRFFTGQISDGRFYGNRCLSAEEVRQLYLEWVQGYPTLLNRIEEPFTYYVPAAATTSQALAFSRF